MSELTFYKMLLIDIKQRIRQAQTKAILSANAELISMYWDIGKMLVEKQKVAGWGAAVIPRWSENPESMFTTFTLLSDSQKGEQPGATLFRWPFFCCKSKIFV